jgi:hypothetical protein
LQVASLHLQVASLHLQIAWLHCGSLGFIASLRLVLDFVARLRHPGAQDVSHTGGIFLGLLGDVFGQHGGFFRNGRQFQRVQSIRLLLLALRRLLGQTGFNLALELVG